MTKQDLISKVDYYNNSIDSLSFPEFDFSYIEENIKVLRENWKTPNGKNNLKQIEEKYANIKSQYNKVKRLVDDLRGCKLRVSFSENRSK